MREKMLLELRGNTQIAINAASSPSATLPLHSTFDDISLHVRVACMCMLYKIHIENSLNVLASQHRKRLPKRIIV